MQELIRFVFLAFVALFVLFSKFRSLGLSFFIENIKFICSFLLLIGLVQCRSVFTETMDRQKKALSDVNYINLCMFRKSRLCDCKIRLYFLTISNRDYLFISDIREMDNTNVDQKG
jgi:hypothetical protein